MANTKTKKATNGNDEHKKTAVEVVIERFLKDVDEKGSMAWQRPYERYDSFNYFTKKHYMGINRLLLPFGEYMTANQIKQYNIDKGYMTVGEDGKYVITDEAFKFQKGIEWYPVVFFKRQTKEVTEEEANDAIEGGCTLPDNADDGYSHFLGRDKRGYSYLYKEGVITRQKNILRYFMVADRKWFKNARGECLPSRIDTGEVKIVLSDPNRVIEDYVARSGVKVDKEYADVPCYIPALDEVKLNPYHKSANTWYATAFHEFAHSTGAKGRLNREGIVTPSTFGSDKYAKEECVAEICAYLCCAETGVYDFETSQMKEYENNLAYVQHWKQKIKDWGSNFIYIVSQADKAFAMICGGQVEKAENTVLDEDAGDGED